MSALTVSRAAMRSARRSHWVAMASVASASALRRRRSDRPEILPATARGDHLVVPLRPAQTRRNDATASVALTGLGGGEASAG